MELKRGRGLEARLLCRSDDPCSDLASIRDQKRSKLLHFLHLLPSSLRIPQSLPSGELQDAVA